MIPIGGEFWYQDKLQNYNIKNKIDKSENLLSGGLSAIRYILSKINLDEQEIILLPTFLCPTIIKLVSDMGIRYKLYNVTKYLSIDIDSMRELIDNYNVRAVFFINYFGFYHNNKVINFIKGLKSKDIIVVEDAVQIFWIKNKMKFIGDYVFNSYRKFLPIDGALVIGGDRCEFTEVSDSYFNLMEKAREYKTNLIIKNSGNEIEMIKKFNEANREYYTRNEIYGINKKYKKFLESVPEEYLIKIRKENYKKLYCNLKNKNGISMIYQLEDIEAGVPLVLPIFVNNRDIVRKELMKFNIFAPIHWDLNEDEILNKDINAMEISSNILSLPIDWRYGIKEMNYIAEKLIYIVNSVK